MRRVLHLGYGTTLPCEIDVRGTALTIPLWDETQKHQDPKSTVRKRARIIVSQKASIRVSNRDNNTQHGFLHHVQLIMRFAMESRVLAT